MDITAGPESPFGNDKKSKARVPSEKADEHIDSARLLCIGAGDDEVSSPFLKIPSGNSPYRNGSVRDDLVKSTSFDAASANMNVQNGWMREDSLGYNLRGDSKGLSKEQSLGGYSHRSDDDQNGFATFMEEVIVPKAYGDLTGKLYSPLYNKNLRRPCAAFFADRISSSESTRAPEDISQHGESSVCNLSPEEKSMRRRYKKVRFRQPKEEVKSSWFDLGAWRRSTDSALWVQRWDMLFILPLSFEMWSFPFRLALPGWAASQTTSPGFHTTLFFLDVCVDLCYVIDAVVSIYLKESGEDSRRSKARQYFRTTFLKELFPSLIFYIATEERMPIWVWWAAGLPRFIPRGRRLKKYFKNMEMNLRVDVTKLQVIKFTLVIFMSCHWVGCCYYWMARLMKFQDNTWVGQFEASTPVFTVEHTPADGHYLALLYRGWIGLAPNSYRRPPQNNPELLFSVLVMFLAMYLSAYLLGAVLPYIVKTDPVAEKHRKELSDFQRFAEERQLPLDLSHKVAACLEFQHKKSVEQNVSASVELTRSLEVKVANKKFWPAISRCASRGNVFFRCDQQFLSSLAAKLHEVYLMPGELLVRGGDMCHELYFVQDGVVNLLDGRNNVVREIRGDVQEMSCMVGELSFFLGIAQVQAIQASPDGDAKLLVLTAKEADELLAVNPEQKEQIVHNLLADFGLNSRGEETGWGGAGQGEEADAAKNTLREQIKASLKRRNAEVFGSLSYASTVGDIEEVRRLLKRKANVDAANYDGRTTLHMASAEGNARVVELLLEHGANKNFKNRWGLTPLQEAVFAKQMHVAQQLVRAGAELLVDDPAGAMCEAAASGDEEFLKLLMANDVDPNLGDYDARCPLHIAAAEGQDKVVELLLVSKANVNQKDRWGGTALQDAIVQQKASVSDLLRSKGGELPTDVGSSEFCAAAAAGDCPRLRVLHSCGVDSDQGDYDNRTPLHLAAAEGKILAVNFLIGVSASVDVQDRWGATPLDDAIRGGTKYHLICGKMIQAWGGCLGNLSGTEEGAEGMRKMGEINMKDVSHLVKKLIAKGLYNKKESSATEPQLLACFETTCSVIKDCQAVQERFEAPVGVFETAIQDMQSLQDSMKSFLLSLTKILDLRGVKSDRRMRKEKRELKALCNGVEKNNVGHEENLMNLFDHLNTETVNEEDLLDQGQDEGIYELYAELDELLLQRERELAMGRRGAEKIAKQFNRYLMQLGDAHQMFETLHEVLLAKCADSLTLHESGAKLMSREGFLVLLHALGMKHVGDDEAHDMFDKAVAFPNCTSEAVTIAGLLATSLEFRALLLGQDPEHQEEMIYLNKAETLRALPLCELVALAEETQTLQVEAGELLFVEGQVCNKIIIITRGELTLLKQDTDTGEEVEVSEMHDEAVLGEFSFFTGLPALCTAKALSTTDVLQIDFERILHTLVDLPQVATHIARALVPKAIQEEKERFGADHVHDEEETVKRIMRLMRKRFKMSAKEREALEAGFGLEDAAIRRSSSGESSYHNTPFDVDALDIPFAQIRRGMQVIDESWKIFSNGGTTVPVSMIREVSRYLGEVGAGFNREAFEVFGQKPSIMIDDWWACWMHFFDGSARAMAKEANGEDTENQVKDETEMLIDRRSQIDSLGLPELPPYKQLLWTMGIGSRIKDMILDPSLSAHYEPVYVAITGSTKENLTIDMVPHFIGMLVTDADFDLTREHVVEFLEVFTSNDVTDEVQWADIRRVLRDTEGKSSMQEHSAFMPGGYIFNPQSLLFRRWYSVMRCVALYHFCMVPVRLTYRPFASMSDPVLLSTELVMDVFVICYVMIHFNTAYTNKKSRWVTNRYKIAKAYLASAFIFDLLAAFPFDWQALATGSSMGNANWMRLPKMLLMRIVWFPTRSSGQSRPTGLKRLAGVAAMLLHISACLWSSLGLHNPEEEDGVTWYNSDSAERFLSGLPGYNAEEGTVTMWELYCISLHWVATHTVSSIGNTTLYPKNWAEIIYAICQLSVGMTFYRMVLGQISTRVMQSDQTIISLRSKLGSLDKFIAGNGLEKDTTLANEIRRHFHTTQSMDQINVASMLGKLSRSLQFEMADFLTREHLDRVTLFKGASRVFLDTISVMLTEVQYSPEQSIFEAGEVCHSLFIVIRGSVDKFEATVEGEPPHRIGSVKPVSAMGEVSFAFGIKRLFTGQASRLHGCVLLRLDRQAYLQALRLCPDDEHLISDNALQCFENAKTEHSKSGSHAGSSHGGSRKGGSVAGSVRDLEEEKGEEVNNADEKSDIDSGGELESEENSVVNSDDFESVVGGERATHIHELKAKQKNEAISNLMDAAFHGEKERVKLLVSRGTSVNATDSNDRTALHVAASEGHSGVVQLLLEVNADPTLKDTKENTPLNDAVRHKHDEAAKIIRRWGPGYTLVFAGCTGAVKMCGAAATGNLEEMKRLFENGVDVNGGDYDARTPLHLASSNGHAAAVEFLLAQKADVDARDRFNGTALQDAVRHEHEAVQELLFKAGCKMVGLDSGVHMCEAAAVGDVHKVKTLVINGVNPSIADYDQRTALHLAASTGQVDVLNFLLRCEPKIDYNPVDRIGGTPLDDAHRHDQRVAIQMLEAAGAMRGDDPRLPEIVRKQRSLAWREGVELRVPIVKQRRDKCREQLMLNTLEAFFQQTLPTFLKVLNQGMKALKAMQERLDKSRPELKSCLETLEEDAGSSMSTSSATSNVNSTKAIVVGTPLPQSKLARQKTFLEPTEEDGEVRAAAAMLPGAVAQVETGVIQVKGSGLSSPARSPVTSPTRYEQFAKNVQNKLKWSGQPFACSSAKLTRLIHGSGSTSSSGDVEVLQEDVRAIFVQNNQLLKTLAELLAEIPDDPSDVRLGVVISRHFRKKRDELRRKVAFTLALAKHMKTILLHPTSTRLFPAKELLDSISRASSTNSRNLAGNMSRRSSVHSTVSAF